MTSRTRREPQFTFGQVLTLVGWVTLCMVAVVALVGQNTAQQQADAARPVVGKVNALCDAGKVSGGGVCEDARRAQEAVQAATPTALPPVTVVPAVTRQDLAALRSYIDRRAGDRKLTPREVARLAVGMIRQPRDGRDAQVPQETLMALVAAYCADGSCKGEPAEPVTGEQVLAQVAAYCTADPSPCVGQPGPQGVSFTDFDIRRGEGGQCLFVVNVVNPASGQSGERSKPIPDAVCEQPTAEQPPPSTEPTR